LSLSLSSSVCLCAPSVILSIDVVSSPFHFSADFVTMATDIRTAELREPVDVATYLFTRLKQLGIDSVHGVPGDFNLVALDYLPECGLKWVGNCNELNAGYAADGYARIKGISAVVTTFGVGELSIPNAIAGA